MGLFPAADFSYLTVDERADLEQAFIDAGIVYDTTTRDRLLDGVNRQFVAAFLPLLANPYDLLASDLRRMSQIERLTDGTVPLKQWLRNATRRFGVLPQRTLFEQALEKVMRTGESAASTVAAAETAPIDFEEIITDNVDDLLDVAFLSLGAARLPAIAKLETPRYEGGVQIVLPGNAGPYIGAGTGWLIASDLLMTNYHVIRNRLQTEAQPSDADLRLQALGTQAQFFYNAPGEKGRRIAIAELIAVGKSKTEDFALLRLAEKPAVDFLPISDEQVKLPEREATPKGTVTKAFAVNIIQHPDGGPKRVALRNNLVYSAEYPKLHYFTDTLGGSSGSPVFDDTWRVIALHRAAVPEQAAFQGRTLGYVNQGIQIHAILAALDELAKTDTQVKAALKQIREEQLALVG